MAITIRKKEFKGAVKKAIICTIKSQAEIIDKLGQDEEGAGGILVEFYKKLIKRVYEKKEELKCCDDVNEIYSIAFECLYKNDKRIHYVNYEENMLCLMSISALCDELHKQIVNYYCELERHIEKALEEE